MSARDRNEPVAKLAEESEICGDSQEKNIESRFECPICLTWLKDPVLTSCGHKFCSACISTWLKREGACCPVDSKPLDPDKDLFEDRYTSREISQQRTDCPFHALGCKVRMSPVDMEKHVQEAHAFACPFNELGCRANFQDEEALGEHLKANVNNHLTVSSVGCSCARRKYPVFAYLRGVAQSQIKAKALESKLWDPPPKNLAGTANASAPSVEWQKLLDNMYERLVILEQQNRELTSALANQETKLNGLQTSLLCHREEMILRNCQGVYVWRLCSFSEKLDEMRTDPLRMFYSPGFYTSSMGYKICARVNVSPKDPDYLSILVHMMQSENDDALDWPFDGTISFVLVHPHCHEKSIREKTTSRPDLEAFKKPTSDLNKRSFGYTEFVRMHELRDFLQNDCLLFRIEVRSADRLDDCEFQAF